MAASESAAPGGQPTLAFPFLSLHTEIRYMIYREVFSHRSVTLRDRLSPADAYMCGRRYWHYYLGGSSHNSDGTLSLLLVCKQIFAEAQPFLQKFTPSHLILSKNIHELPSRYESNDFGHKLGLPTSHITRLTFSATNLGENKEMLRECPGPPESREMNFFHCGFTCNLGFGFDPKEGPPPDPNRLPNLEKIHNLSHFFSNLLPALREVHIHHVLDHSLRNLPEPCWCPIAGSDSCTCGKCKCTCTTYPPLPQSETMSFAETEAELRKSLLSRFRSALPTQRSEFDRHYSDCYTILDLLAHGVHIFLHDEIKLTVPMVESDKFLCKGSWKARYHLAPPSNAKEPAAPPTAPAESPHERSLKRRKEAKSRALATAAAFANVWNEQPKVDAPLDPGAASVDVDEYIPTSDTILDFSTLENSDVLENFDFDSFLNYSSVRDLPDNFVVKPLVAYEDSFDLRFVDESMFDQVLDQEEFLNDISDKGKWTDRNRESSIGWHESQGELWVWQ